MPSLLLGDVQSRLSLLTSLSKQKDVTAICGDHASQWNVDVGVTKYTLPLFFLHSIDLFKNATFNTNIRTDHCFNFMINKKMLHRYLTLRLVEYHKLKSFDYTYSGSAKNINDSKIFEDLAICDPNRERFPPDLLMQILGDVTISPKFLGIKDFVNIAQKEGYVINYKYIHGPWQLGINKIFSSSFISLTPSLTTGIMIV